MTAAPVLRSLRTTWRVPALTLTPLLTSVFFLLIYAGAMTVLVVATTLAGVGFSLLGAAVAIRFGTDAAVTAATMAFFPLAFLTGAFAPRSELTGRMFVGAWLNPLGYLLDGLRSVTAADIAATGSGLLTLVALLAAGVFACAVALHRVRVIR